jgi:hypothetical protein
MLHPKLRSPAHQSGISSNEAVFQPRPSLKVASSPSSSRVSSRLHNPSASQPNSTMSTPPQTITSPPTSPLPKRTKVSHDTPTHIPKPLGASLSSILNHTESTTNGEMSTTSEPQNIPPPVTKVSDAPPLLIKKLSANAKLPTRGSAFAAGYDLYASKEAIVPARGKVLVDTDISMAVPAGTCALRIPRPSLFLFLRNNGGQLC